MGGVEQAPLSKGAGCGQSPQTGGLPRPQMPPPGACTVGDCPPANCRPRGPPKRAPPSVNGISRRNNPSVLASLGHLPLTREAKTAPTAANRADMESAPTGVCITQRPRDDASIVPYMGLPSFAVRVFPAGRGPSPSAVGADSISARPAPPRAIPGKRCPTRARPATFSIIRGISPKSNRS